MKPNEIHILVIEDNPADLRLISEMLKGHVNPTFSITHAERLNEALVKIKSTAFDIALLDINLPDSSGLTGVEEIFKQAQTLPLVVLTGMDDDNLGLQAIKNHATDYLAKGKIDQTLLVRSIRYAIERKQAEEQLKTSLREKEVLLRELYHRTKNNMEVISSLIHLHILNTTDERVLKPFKEMQGRILAMSLVHEKLYKSQNLSSIDTGDYIGSLANTVLASFGNADKNITLKINADNVPLNIDLAIPCGLIINELMTNALKYAFPNSNSGQISISLHSRPDDEIELVFADNGVGLPDNFNLKQAETLGTKIVFSLATGQLEGKIDLLRNKGTEYRIRFKNDSKTFFGT
jgi:two-component sensor histidine kinase/CheY-like chemotaxis protein